MPWPGPVLDGGGGDNLSSPEGSTPSSYVKRGGIPNPDRVSPGTY